MDATGVQNRASLRRSLARLARSLHFVLGLSLPDPLAAWLLAVGLGFSHDWPPQPLAWRRTICLVVLIVAQGLRELIIGRIKNESYFDYCFKRGDSNAKAFASYADWLASLSDEDLLDTYDRVREADRDYWESERQSS